MDCSGDSSGCVASPPQAHPSEESTEPWSDRGYHDFQAAPNHGTQRDPNARGNISGSANCTRNSEDPLEGEVVLVAKHSTRGHLATLLFIVADTTHEAPTEIYSLLSIIVADTTREAPTEFEEWCSYKAKLEDEGQNMSPDRGHVESAYEAIDGPVPPQDISACQTPVAEGHVVGAGQGNFCTHGTGHQTELQQQPQGVNNPPLGAHCSNMSFPRKRANSQQLPGNCEPNENQQLLGSCNPGGSQQHAPHVSYTTQGSLQLPHNCEPNENQQHAPRVSYAIQVSQQLPGNRDPNENQQLLGSCNPGGSQQHALRVRLTTQGSLKLPGNRDSNENQHQLAPLNYTPNGSRQHPYFSGSPRKLPPGNCITSGGQQLPGSCHPTGSQQQVSHTSCTLRASQQLPGSCHPTGSQQQVSHASYTLRGSQQLPVVTSAEPVAAPVLNNINGSHGRSVVLMQQQQQHSAAQQQQQQQQQNNNTALHSNNNGMDVDAAPSPGPVLRHHTYHGPPRGPPSPLRGTPIRRLDSAPPTWGPSAWGQTSMEGNTSPLYRKPGGIMLDGRGEIIQGRIEQTSRLAVGQEAMGGQRHSNGNFNMGMPVRDLSDPQHMQGLATDEGVPHNRFNQQQVQDTAADVQHNRFNQQQVQGTGADGSHSRFNQHQVMHTAEAMASRNQQQQMQPPDVDQEMCNAQHMQHNPRDPHHNFNSQHLQSREFQMTLPHEAQALNGLEAMGHATLHQGRVTGRFQQHPPGGDGTVWQGQVTGGWPEQQGRESAHESGGAAIAGGGGGSGSYCEKDSDWQGTQPQVLKKDQPGMHETTQKEGEKQGNEGKAKRASTAKERKGLAASTGTSRSSCFRGVSKHRRSGRWEAHIWVKDIGRQVYLGGYELEEHAAEAYDVAALKSLC
eukprot:gene8773-33640_t